MTVLLSSSSRTSTGRRPGSAPTRAVRTLPPLLLCLLGVTAGLMAGRGGTSPTEAGLGLADPGELTRRLLPVSRALFDLTAVGTVGVLVASGWLLDDDDAGTRRRLLKASVLWSAGWCLAGALSLAATTSQVAGVPVADLIRSPGLFAYGLNLPQGRALLLVLVVSLSTALWGGALRTATGAKVWAAVALFAMAPLLTTGHAATASNHFLAAESLMVHVLAVTVWVGGLLALVTLLRHDREVLCRAVPRFSRLALFCFVGVGVSGLLGAWTRIGLEPRLWVSTYGALLLLKTAAFVLVGALGWLHRARSVRDLRAGRPRAFARIAGVEVAVMGAAVGLAVALSTTAPPAGAAVRAAPVHAAEFPTVDATLPPVSLLNLLTVVQSSPVVVTALVAAVGGYLAWARRSPGRMQAWSTGRRAAFGLGVLMVAWALCGGLSSYAPALLSAQVGQLLTLGLVAPVLLVAGLAPRPEQRPVGSRSSVLALLDRASPVNTSAVMVLLLAATFQTPLLTMVLRSVPAHLALALAALALGVLQLLPARLGRHGGRGTSRRPETRAGLVLVAGVLVVDGWRLYTSTTAFADGWFRDLDWRWVDAAADQRLAGLLMAGSGIALVTVVAVVGLASRLHHRSAGSV